MWTDPIVDEVRRIREEHAARFNYDLDAIIKDFQESQRLSGRPVVSLSPRLYRGPGYVPDNDVQAVTTE